MRPLFFTFVFSFCCFFSQAQEPALKISQPEEEDITVSSPKQFIVGKTCKDCIIKINDSIVKVFSTGVFARQLQLTEGKNNYTVISISPSGKQKSKTIRFTYFKTQPETSISDTMIAYVQTFPEGDLMLRTGDEIRFKVKALPLCIATLSNGTPLYELPDSITNGIKGIYQGMYRVHDTDRFVAQPFRVRLTTTNGKIIEKNTKALFSILSQTGPDVVITNNRLSHLEYGLGDDRLGGAKIGYLDTLVPLKVIGKVGVEYKIQLAPGRTAYIEEKHVNSLPRGTFPPASITDKIRVYADSLHDYVKLGLFQKLPYQSFHQLDPARIVVDVFGATSNTNWIDFPDSVKEITHVAYEQIADGVFRINITLKHQQHWGHRLYYEGNNLVIQIRRPPKKLSLNGLCIAVDAGHGGSNTGAGGPSGSSEKELALKLALELRDQLRKEGAKVMMTRDKEMFVDNKDRILMYRDSTPDLLLSIHLNSSSDPINISGTSVFYRYEGFRAFGHAIYKRLLETGLKDYGNNGSFNFMLNGPTEYPNALIETLFLSNPEEEEKMLDEKFRKLLAEKIVQGIKDFLLQSK